MANLNDEFLEFNQSLQLTNSKKELMITSRENLREKIKKYFEEKHPAYRPIFYIQGSYKMKTSIRTKDDYCDLDDGVYFIPEPSVTAPTLHGWVYDAVCNVTNLNPIRKNKCIRVKYAKGYHIDIPIYKKASFDASDKPKLAVKDTGYIESDPHEIVNWFQEAKKKHPEVVRIVCYFKAWADNISHSMPSGLAWTTLVVDNLFIGQRDDIVLVRTAENVLNKLKTKFQCIVHGTPYDDLFADYDDEKRNRILDDLTNLVAKGENALTEKNKLKASKMWRQLLGDRFPLAEDVTEPGVSVEYLKEYAEGIRNNNIYLSKSGTFGEKGILAQPHKFYGSKK